MGTHHKLLPELQLSAVQVSRKKAKDNRKDFDEKLVNMYTSKEVKEGDGLKKGYSSASEDYIVGDYFFEQYHSLRCWRDAKTAHQVYKKLKSELARLEAVK